MADPFSRMRDRLLAGVLGLEAVLRVGEPCRVSIERGVAMLGEFGVVVAYRDVVTISSDLVPRPGDALVTVADGRAYTLDSIQGADGYTTQFTLRTP